MARINERAAPTVIVARTPRPGREREFEQWLRQITAEAARMPGHLGSDLQPPGPHHPGEWVIVYQFEQQPLLDAWIDSPIRSDLLTDGAELTEGNARVQQLAMGPGIDPVTAVASFRILAGKEEPFARWYDSLLDSIAHFEGFLQAQLFPPVDGVQDETVIVFSFQSRDKLDEWLESDTRDFLLTELHQFTDGERQVNVVGGFGGWFNVGPHRVKTWKQAAIVLLALYPTVLLLNEILGRAIPDVPYALAILIGNVFSVALLSWVLMPRLTSLFDRWLQR